MNSYEAEVRYWRQALVCEALWKQIRALDAAGADFLDAERLRLHERWCTATEFLVWLFERTPDGRAIAAADGDDDDDPDDPDDFDPDPERVPDAA
jgi:hypothetical protein